MAKNKSFMRPSDLRRAPAPPVHEHARLLDDAPRGPLFLAAICALLLLTTAYLRSEQLQTLRTQGTQAAEQAQNSTRSALAMWSPQQGWGPLRGRAFTYMTPWGASVTLTPVPEASGDQALTLEVAFSNAPQCEAFLNTAVSYFDAVYVDSKPANPAHKACSVWNQNALRLVKYIAAPAPQVTPAPPPAPSEPTPAARAATLSEIAEAQRRQQQSAGPLAPP